jgi:hypothetical protein
MHRKKHALPSIPEPFRIIGASAATTGTKTAKVPTLILSGEWLKAVGFPINAGAYPTTDRRGELTLHRLGLGLPRSLRILAGDPGPSTERVVRATLRPATRAKSRP